MKNKKVSYINLFFRIFFMQFKVVPQYTIIFIFVVILEALALTMGIVFTRRTFDIISNAAMGQYSFAECLIPVLFMISITFGQHIMNGMKFFQWSLLSGKTRGIINVKLYKKVQFLKAEQFEDTSFLDDLEKAKQGIYPLASTSLIILNLIFFDGVYFFLVGSFLFALKPMLLFTLLLAFIPALLSQIVRLKIFSKLENESSPLRREVEYYGKTLYDREYFKETRLLGAFKYFYKLFNETLLLLTHKQWNAQRKMALLEFALNIVSFAGMGISIYILFVATMNGEISVGAFAAVFYALAQIFDIMQWVLKWEINDINRDIGKVINLLNILDLPQQDRKQGTVDFSKGIVAENMRFTYNGKTEPAINNVSLTIKKDEVIAIVGENGSGKSTLVRLLTGLYCPAEGRVMVGGLNTMLTAPHCIFSETSGVFQKYQRYKMSLLDNISISDVVNDANNTRVEMALKEAGVYLENEDIELNTMLSPEFNGIDLSGGQWQRIAIARGLYRKNNFIVLDEPTAAIDPIEENMIYEKFMKLAKNKCAIVVTHRLGSVKMVNRIIVLDKGKIVDVGTHDELLSRPGRYVDMWTAQAKWYIREED